MSSANQVNYVLGLILMNIYVFPNYIFHHKQKVLWKAWELRDF